MVPVRDGRANKGADPKSTDAETAKRVAKITRDLGLV